MELLSPVKNYENAQSAIINGADALYLASPSFGARSNASLTIAEIAKIIDLAKLYNISTYVTFNTVIFDDELLQFFEELNQIYQLGATGIIIQDFALINILHQLYPDLEVHCSTQMHVHNTFATNFCQSLGANRIVVPREMSFERIKTIKEATGIEIEAFVHGALCVSYSGQCYDSALLDQKSANRGRCSQYCRMPQDIINLRTGKIVSKGNYPLNLRDLNNLNNLEKYQTAGVSSLKIEGRLKQIDYVGFVTQQYRKKLDSLKTNSRNKKEIISSDDLTRVYNRTFTTGRINHINGEALVNLNRPNNNGYEVGKVINIEINRNEDLKFYKYILEIATTSQLYLHDNIRFIDNSYEDGQVIEQIENSSDNSILIYSNSKPPLNSTVFRTSEFNLLKKLKAETIGYSKKIIIKYALFITKNEIIYQLLNEDNSLKKEFIFPATIEYAQKKGIDQETVLKTLAKTNNTPYLLQNNDFYLEENLFIPISILKKLRDEIISNYQKLTISPNKRTSKDFTKYLNTSSQTITNILDKNLYLEVRTLAQLEFLNNNLINIYNNYRSSYTYTFNIMLHHTLASTLQDDNILLENMNNSELNYYLVLPRVIYDDESSTIEKLTTNFKNLCICELGSLQYLNTQNFDNIITNFTFNTTNLINQNDLLAQGISKTILSIELNEEKLANFANPHSIIPIFGKIPVMLMDFCPINLTKTDSCGSCRKCRGNSYALKDKLGREFPLLYEGNNKIGMYSKEPINLFPYTKNNLDNNFVNFQMIFSNEEPELIETILSNFFTHKKLDFQTSSGSYHKEIL